MDSASWSYSWILLLARTCLALVFLVSGFHKAVCYQEAVAEFRAAKVPLIGITLPATIALHLVGSVCLIIGAYTGVAALSLAVFTLIATERAHAFWRFGGSARVDRSRDALANLAVIGGLLLLALVGPGRITLF